MNEYDTVVIERRLTNGFHGRIEVKTKEEERIFHIDMGHLKLKVTENESTIYDKDGNKFDLPEIGMKAIGMVVLKELHDIIEGISLLTNGDSLLKVIENMEGKTEDEVIDLIIGWGN